MQESPLIIECLNFNSNGKHELAGWVMTNLNPFLLVSDLSNKILILIIVSGWNRKVQKSLAELEKLHSIGEGEHLFLPTTEMNDHQNKVLTSPVGFGHNIFCIVKSLPNQYIFFSLLLEGFKESAICGQIFWECSTHIPGLLGWWMWTELHGGHWFHWYYSHLFCPVLSNFHFV